MRHHLTRGTPRFAPSGCHAGFHRCSRHPRRPPHSRGIARELEEGMLDQELSLPPCGLTCPLCAAEVDLSIGDSVLEVLWMHEYECSALTIDAEAVLMA